MGFADDLRSEADAIFTGQWTTRKGQVVPEPEDLKLGNDAVEFEQATVLYADLSGSTNMVDTKLWSFAAEVYKAYLYCAAKIIRQEGGTITSYDGDRVMGIFVGKTQSTPAAKAALKINYAVRNIINPSIRAVYSKSDFQVRQVVGIDTSQIHAARTGVRGGNDIVWVGRAANYAAKLTDIDVDDMPTWITEDVYGRLLDDAKYGGSEKKNMWTSYNWKKGNIGIYGSKWTWKP